MGMEFPIVIQNSTMMVEITFTTIKINPMFVVTLYNINKMSYYIGFMIVPLKMVT